MRPFLCYLGLWHWAQAAAALRITSQTNNGDGGEFGKIVALQWTEAVGKVAATLVSVGEYGNVQSMQLLGDNVIPPMIWKQTDDISEGRYYIQLEDESHDAVTDSSPFSVNTIPKAVSVTSHSPSSTVSSHSSSSTSTAESHATSPSPPRLPVERFEKTSNPFPESGKIAVAVCATVVGIAVIGLSIFCLYRRRKKKSLTARNSNSTGAEEKMLGIPTQFQSATQHPLALDAEDHDQKILSRTVKISLFHEDLPVLPSQSPRPSPFTPHNGEVERWKTYKSPIESLVSMGTHELEQLPPELESPAVKKRPSELDGRMIQPNDVEKAGPVKKGDPVGKKDPVQKVDPVERVDLVKKADAAELPKTRRARFSRGVVGSGHWTFLRGSSATDGLK